MSETAGTPSRWRATALKWVGGITAGISLLLGIQQVVSWIGDGMQRRREVTTLVEMARAQSARSAHAEAWASLDRAGQVRPDTEFTDARVDVAFAWLQDARPGPGKEFRTITDVVTPALDRALVTAKEARRADLLAHLGWATFLRTRDGESGDPAARYDEALALDPGNVYANAMLGHWLLWRGGEIADARERFATAVRGPASTRPFVRRLQLAALMNRGESADGELLRVATDMRRGGEAGTAIPPNVANYIYWIYTMRYGRAGAARPVDAGEVPPADVKATFEWILPMSESAQNSPGLTEAVRAALGPPGR
jgi:hypothetical protein